MLHIPLRAINFNTELKFHAISCDMRDLLNLSDFNAINDCSPFNTRSTKEKLKWTQNVRLEYGWPVHLLKTKSQSISVGFSAKCFVLRFVRLVWFVEPVPWKPSWGCCLCACVVDIWNRQHFNSLAGLTGSCASGELDWWAIKVR